MIDDFSKYEQMRDQGSPPKAVCSAARADAVDEITIVRLLRKVYGLTLREAKDVMGADEALTKKQEVGPGTVVYWDGWTSDEGFYIMQAQVRSIRGQLAELEEHKKFRITPAGLEEVPVLGPQHLSLRVSYLETPLVERFGDLLEFVNELSRTQMPVS